MTHSAESDASGALYRLFDQAFNTAGDAAGRGRARRDYLTVRDALTRVTPPEGTNDAEG